MSVAKKCLMDNIEVVNFIVTGYHLVELDIPNEVNASVASQLDAL